MQEYPSPPPCTVACECGACVYMYTCSNHKLFSLTLPDGGESSGTDYDEELREELEKRKNLIAAKKKKKAAAEEVKRREAAKKKKAAAAAEEIRREAITRETVKKPVSSPTPYLPSLPPPHQLSPTSSSSLPHLPSPHNSSIVPPPQLPSPPPPLFLLSPPSHPASVETGFLKKGNRKRSIKGPKNFIELSDSESEEEDDISHFHALEHLSKTRSLMKAKPLLQKIYDNGVDGDAERSQSCSEEDNSLPPSPHTQGMAATSSSTNTSEVRGEGNESEDRQSGGFIDKSLPVENCVVTSDKASAVLEMAKEAKGRPKATPSNHTSTVLKRGRGRPKATLSSRTQSLKKAKPLLQKIHNEGVSGDTERSQSCSEEDDPLPPSPCTEEVMTTSSSTFGDGDGSEDGQNREGIGDKSLPAENGVLTSDESSATLEIAKKSRGRPKATESNNTSTVLKRGRGKPKAILSRNTSIVLKRGRGRPKATLSSKTQSQPFLQNIYDNGVDGDAERSQSCSEEDNSLPPSPHTQGIAATSSSTSTSTFGAEGDENKGGQNGGIGDKSLPAENHFLTSAVLGTDKESRERPKTIHSSDTSTVLKRGRGRPKATLSNDTSTVLKQGRENSKVTLSRDTFTVLKRGRGRPKATLSSKTQSQPLLQKIANEGVDGDAERSQSCSEEDDPLPPSPYSEEVMTTSVACTSRFGGAEDVVDDTQHRGVGDKSSPAENHILTSDESISRDTSTVLKRGRGRPKATFSSDTSIGLKRGRGRPEATLLNNTSTVLKRARESSRDTPSSDTSTVFNGVRGRPKATLSRDTSTVLKRGRGRPKAVSKVQDEVDDHSSPPSHPPSPSHPAPPSPSLPAPPSPSLPPLPFLSSGSSNLVRNAVMEKKKKKKIRLTKGPKTVELSVAESREGGDVSQSSALGPLPRQQSMYRAKPISSRLNDAEMSDEYVAHSEDNGEVLSSSVCDDNSRPGNSTAQKTTSVSLSMASVGKASNGAEVGCNGGRGKVDLLSVAQGNVTLTSDKSSVELKTPKKARGRPKGALSGARDKEKVRNKGREEGSENRVSRGIETPPSSNVWFDPPDISLSSLRKQGKQRISRGQQQINGDAGGERESTVSRKRLPSTSKHQLLANRSSSGKRRRSDACSDSSGDDGGGAQTVDDGGPSNERSMAADVGGASKPKDADVYSFSDDDENDLQLITTPAGRKYIRMDVAPKSTYTPGVRRSRRTRVAPVKAWGNEQLEYDVTNDSGKISVGATCVSLRSLILICFLHYLRSEAHRYPATL